MTTLKSQRNAAFYSILFVALMALSSSSYADYFPFRVAFENVPGVAEITSGNVSQGIEILRQELENENADAGHVLATLCGAYIIDSSLEEAAQVCTDAVDKFPGETAFNNRGVLRALTGDFEGARRDFDRARPERMDDYLEYLKTKDVGLIATGNYGLLQELSAKHSPVDVQASVAMATGSDIENFDD